MDSSVKSERWWGILPGWLRGLIRTLRLKQWVKNGFIFLPVLFDRKISLSHPEPFIRVLIAFALFCLMSSAVYVLNDLVDVDKDRKHPKKRNRPIASGLLPIPIAQVTALVLPVVSFIGAWLFSIPLALVIATYYLKDLAYSFYLKNVVILDVMTLASGFILRVIAGAVVITLTNFSPWLYMCVGALALFLAVGKRRQEMVLMGADAHYTRAILQEYNLDLVNNMLLMVATASVITYSLYAVEAKTSFGGSAMLLTVPFVVYGVFRYLYLVHVKGEGGAPDELLFKDKPLLFSVILFVMVSSIIIYVAPFILKRMS